MSADGMARAVKSCTGSILRLRLRRLFPHESRLIVPHGRTAKVRQDDKAQGVRQLFIPILGDACIWIFLPRRSGGGECTPKSIIHKAVSSDQRSDPDPPDLCAYHAALLCGERSQRRGNAALDNTACQCQLLPERAEMVEPPWLANKVYIPLCEGSPRRTEDFPVKKLNASRHEWRSIPWLYAR